MAWWDPLSFGIYVGTSPEKVDEGLSGIDAILNAIAQDGLLPGELERAQRYLVGTHGIGLQRLGARGSAMLFGALYGLGYAEHLNYAKRVLSVDQAAVKAFAASLIDARSRVVSIVGPDGTGGPAATFEPAGLSIADSSS